MGPGRPTLRFLRCLSFVMLPFALILWNVDAVDLSCDARESHSYTFVCLSEHVMCRCSVTDAVRLQWDLKVANDTHTQTFVPNDFRGQFEMANGFNFTLDEKEQDPDHPLRSNLTSSVTFITMGEVTNITIQCSDFVHMMAKTLFVPGAPFPPVNITHNVTNFNSDCNVTVVTMWESVGEGIVYMVTVLPQNITTITSDTHVQFNTDLNVQVNYTFSVIAINECNETSEEVQSEFPLESMEKCSGTENGPASPNGVPTLIISITLGVLVVAVIVGIVVVCYIYQRMKEKIKWILLSDDRKNRELEIFRKGELGDVKKWVEKKRLNLNAVRDTEGKTPLHLAAEHGKLKVVQYLIEELESDVRNKEETSVHFDAREEVVDCHTQRHGCSIDVTDNYDNTPLHLAVREGKRDIVEHLIEKGCDQSRKNSHGMTPIRLAIMGGHEGIEEYIHAQMIRPKTFIDACSEGTLDDVKRLVQKGNDPTKVHDRDGKSLLQLAAEKCSVKVVKYLVEEAKCNVNEFTPSDGRKPLHYAARSGKVEVVKYLMEECECSASDTDKEKKTPLHLAAQEGGIKVVEYLTQRRDCNMNVTDNCNSTPLHLAAREGRLKVVECLIKKGCDQNSQDIHGRTPIRLAIMSGHEDVEEYIRTQMTLPKKLIDACKEGSLEAVKHLVEAGLDPSKVFDVNRRTPLQIVEESGHKDVEEYIRTQMTLRKKLIDACKEGRLEDVKHLVEAGLDPSKVFDVNRRTPLQLAEENGHLDIAEYLREKSELA